MKFILVMLFLGLACFGAFDAKAELFIMMSGQKDWICQHRKTCDIAQIHEAGTSPVPAELQLFARIRQTGFDDGLICFPVGGNVDGVNGDIVIIAPPYNASDDESRRSSINSATQCARC